MINVKCNLLTRWLHARLFEGKIDVSRRAYIWNLASSIASSTQSAVFLLVVTRVSGSAIAGSFIILLTLAQTFSAIGNYNIRDFQVSDVRGEYQFATYYTTRMVTCCCMMLVAIGYGFLQQYESERIIVLICLSGYRMIECIEDVYHGMVQRAGRFDVTSICMTIRILIADLTFCLVFIITRNAVTASFLMMLISLLVFLTTMSVVRMEFRELKPAVHTEHIIKLLIACFPVFIGAFMYAYLNSAPKYAIEGALSPEIQTIYNILFMPVLVVNVLSTMIYKPMIVQLSELWNDGNQKRFLSILAKIVLLTVGLTCALLIGGYLIGLRLLEIVYGVTLNENMRIFLMLLAFGGVAALEYFFSTLLTIIRKQQFILVGYGIALIVHLLATNKLVQSFGLKGAAYSYGVIVCVLLIVFGAVLAVEMVRTKRNQGERK